MTAELPRVSAILRDTGLGPDLSRVPPAVLAAARARGTAVHEALEAVCYGYLDLAALDPEIKPYLDAYQRFVAESGYHAKYAEIAVTHPSWGYRGHPDSIGFLGPNRIVIDFKTGDATGAEYQVAAYAAAFTAEHPHEPIHAGAVVQLREDGTYRYEEVNLPAATPVWLAAVTVYYAQRRAA